jgi:hypothetical protein
VVTFPPEVRNNGKPLPSRIDLYVVRIGNDGHGNLRYRDAKPCMHCLQILKYYGINRIIYTTDDGYYIERTDEMTTNHITYGIARTMHQ